jgi:hypothetical protein
VITLTAEDNGIFDDPAAPYEVHVVTVTAIYGENNEVNEEYRYPVKNLAVCLPQIFRWAGFISD